MRGGGHVRNKEAAGVQVTGGAWLSVREGFQEACLILLAGRADADEEEANEAVLLVVGCKIGAGIGRQGAVQEVVERLLVNMLRASEVASFPKRTGPRWESLNWLIGGFGRPSRAPALPRGRRCP